LAISPRPRSKRSQRETWAVGFLFREGREVFALDAEGVVDEAVEVDLVGEGEVTLADQSIGAGQNGDEGRGELGEERVRRLHGVLLRQGASATPF
jgi:hypothetical protein